MINVNIKNENYEQKRANNFPHNSLNKQKA